MRALASKGIQSSIHYRPVDTFLAYREAGLGADGQLERTHAIGGRTVTLPLFPSMTEDQIDTVCEAVEAALT